MVGPAFLEESGSHCPQARQAKYFRTCEKMGIKVPKIFDQVYKLDQQNGNSCLLCGDDLYDRRQGI